MNKDSLKNCLRQELDRWSAKPFDVLLSELADTVAYAVEEPEPYQVEVELLESEPGYIHVGIAVDDGGWRAFAPFYTSFLVYRDGRVDKSGGRL